MHFVKLEGDAVFCYADADSFEDGERFVESSRGAAYFAFSNRLLDMKRSTTCSCNACRSLALRDDERESTSPDRT